LTGNNGLDILLSDASLDGPLPFSLTTGADAKAVREFEANPDEKALIAEALSKRPETRISALSIELAEHGQKLAEAPLFPTVALTGTFTYADPNPRVFIQSDAWTPTWALGIQVSYDLGGLPANLKEIDAQARGLSKAQADKAKAQNSVVMDVRTCLLNLARTRRDLALVQGMVDQARENVRVMQQKLDLGIVGAADMLNAQLTLLRSNFTVTNKRIDLQVAAADLTRALALDEIR
jgi:outer membrane protein